jgi:hypothetical protein
MKEKGERERIGKGVWWKRKEGRGFLAKRPSSSSTPGSEQGSEGGGSGAAGRRLLPASQAPAAVRQWGKMTRASREVDSHTYLGWWWHVEAGFPAAADWRWRAWGRRCSGVQGGGARLVAMRGEARTVGPYL